MAHRQSYREGPAHSITAISSTPTPATDCDEDYMYQDNRDTQQIADDSIAFLRTFYLRLQQFRAQVGKFAHADQFSPHTDNTEMSDNDSIKPTTTTTNDTKLNEPLPANEQDDSSDEHPTYTPKLCGQCESSRAEPPNIPPQSPTTQTDQTPPCPRCIL